MMRASSKGDVGGKEATVYRRTCQGGFSSVLSPIVIDIIKQRNGRSVVPAPLIVNPDVFRVMLSVLLEPVSSTAAKSRAVGGLSAGGWLRGSPETVTDCQRAGKVCVDPKDVEIIPHKCTRETPDCIGAPKCTRRSPRQLDWRSGTTDRDFLLPYTPNWGSQSHSPYQPLAAGSLYQASQSLGQRRPQST